MANVKVLMYGWEFPPLISGGLGIACYAIVNELAKKNVDLTLILPRIIAANNINHVNMVGCDQWFHSTHENLVGTVDIKYPTMATYLCPYINAKDFARLSQNQTLADFFMLLAQMHLPEELKNMAIAAAEAQYSQAQLFGKYDVNLLAEVFRYALVAGALAQDVDHEIIHAHDWLTILAALEARRYSHKPVVLHVHALETDRSGLWVDKKIFAIEKYGMEQADQIIAVSRYTKNNIVQYYGINPDKITVIHNGTYIDECCHSKKPQNLPKMVLFLGRITQQKGPYFFLEVARRVLEKRGDVQFVLAGTGNLLIDMIERAAKLRIGKNVHFTGFLAREQVQEIFQLADVYVMPSVSEPFGLSALEALSYDIPAVISKQSGVAELLHHTLVSDFWDTEDMAAKILALLEYPALRQTALDNTRQELRDATWEKTADKILNLYQTIDSRKAQACVII